MYEEYLEDYVYKLMAKIASRICRIFKSNKSKDESETNLVKASSSTKLATQDDEDISKENKEDTKSIEGNKEDKTIAVTKNNTSEKTANNKKTKDTKLVSADSKTDDEDTEQTSKDKCRGKKRRNKDKELDLEEDLNNLNFHMMMFYMWLVVTLVNVPALLTWARNFS